MGLLPNPLPQGFAFPAPASQLQVNNSLFPGAVVPTRFVWDRLLTGAEEAAIANDTQRVHIWGALITKTYSNTKELHSSLLKPLPILMLAI
jgi:hypothetical protein